VLKYALKNALLPVLSYLGPATAAAMTGSFVVEKVFAIPGIGTHFVDAVLGKDITMLMGNCAIKMSLTVQFSCRKLGPRLKIGPSWFPNTHASPDASHAYSE